MCNQLWIVSGVVFVLDIGFLLKHFRGLVFQYIILPIVIIHAVRNINSPLTLFHLCVHFLDDESRLVRSSLAARCVLNEAC